VNDVARVVPDEEGEEGEGEEALEPVGAEPDEE
jgi:hypothetical protein